VTIDGESGWDRRRRHLLREYEKVAVELFAARGFREVTVDDIAEAAGVSARTLFRYFPTKEDFLLGYPRRGVEALVARFEALSPSDNPLETAWETVLAAFSASPPDRKLLRFWRRAAADAQDVLAQIRGERVQALIDVVARYVSESLGVDAATDVRPHVVAGVIAGAELALVESLSRSDLSVSQVIDDFDRTIRGLSEALDVGRDAVAPPQAPQALPG
jgi:AcrR family transcriptional regulator